MGSGVRTERDELLVRRCLACGVPVARTALLGERCRRCGCDFRERPPRTYAEMEGFAEDVDDAALLAIDVHPSAEWSFDDPIARRRRRIVGRWIAFGLIVALLAVVAARLLEVSVR